MNTPAANCNHEGMRWGVAVGGGVGGSRVYGQLPMADELSGRSTRWKILIQLRPFRNCFIRMKIILRHQKTYKRGDLYETAGQHLVVKSTCLCRAQLKPDGTR